MRVIGGIYRSRILTWPDDVKNIRPTKDRIREAIFSALGDISNTTFLDLYSGSGAFGIEAISRGAKLSYFVDINPVAIKTIKGNISSINIPMEYTKILNMPDVDAINHLKDTGSKVDIVFLDPPYKKGQYKDIINMILDSNILSDNGIVITESDYLLELDESRFSKRKDYKYGEIMVSILRR